MNFFVDFIGTVDISNPDKFPMLELAEKLLKLSGSNGKLVSKSPSLDDPKQRQPNLLLAKSKLVWGPNICLEDDLKETIDYFKRVL
jgi:UDP-glucuronate decarboxylase